MHCNLCEYVIVSDFDGTITREDSNDLLFTAYGTPENRQIEKDFRAGILGERQAMRRHFDVKHISKDEYCSFLDANIHIDSGFDVFLQRVNAYNIKFFIVSAGFGLAIRTVLGKERLRGVQVMANDLTGEEYLSPVFAQSEPVCDKDMGPCGNCKKACVETIRRQTNRKILYIGDGLTDRCAVHEADLIFAKKELASYCRSKGLPYTPYENFADITNDLWR